MTSSRIHTLLEDGVLVATIDSPPINLFSLELFAEMGALVARVRDDDAVRVFVVRSANPDFWIAHFDVEAILGFDISSEAQRPAIDAPANAFHEMCETVRTMPKLTIAQIAGRVGGGGSEFAASFDVRFGALESTRINQMEVALGILPGGTGTQRLPRLIGRSRALEVILGSDDLDAATAERWGYLNRALPQGELGPFVDRFARRVAAFPPTAVAAAKQSVLHAEALPLDQGLREEAFLFQQLIRTPEAQQQMRRFLEAGGQTAEGESKVDELIEELGGEPDQPQGNR